MVQKNQLIALAILIFLFQPGQSSPQPVAAERNTHKPELTYSFLIQDTPTRLFTMRQSNINYLNGYRFFVRELDKVFSRHISTLIQFTAVNLFFVPLTHEEGHRSILTARGIGAISQPYYNSKGAAYVVGVRDAELEHLRNTEFPNYIRLHTAGLESDFMLINRMETLGAFDEDDVRTLYVEYVSRKFAQISYYALSLIPKLTPKLDEEANELERDIVGHDVYGAIRHLHRPQMKFYRYTEYDHLTDTEKKFVKRVGFRSLLNVANPMVFQKKNFSILENLKGSFGLGYSMAPFGDFIDENFWFQFCSKIKLHLYLRQFQNREHWFWAGGIRLWDFAFSQRFRTSLTTHLWQQPRQLDFNSSAAQNGAAIDVLVKYFIPLKGSSRVKAISVDLGLLHKNYGFIPEEIILDKTTSIRVGSSILM